MSDLYNLKPSGIMVYSAVWCPDCKRAKQFFGEQRVPYTNVDIEQDERAMGYFQHGQFLGGMIQPVNNSIIPNPVLETFLPFIALQRLMPNEFPVFSDPFQFVEQTRSYR